MSKKSPYTKTSFARAYVLPAIIIFFIPGFSLWFFNHVENYYDKDFRDFIVSKIKADKSHSEKELQESVHFYETVSVSQILASNKVEARPMQAKFESVSTRYAIFRWMKRIAIVCLLTTAVVFVVVGISVLCSFRSQNAQYWSLRLGWNVLRWFALIQVIGQGILAVALSFWVTAYWTNNYFVKLIFAVGIMAVLGVVVLVKAIFAKVSTESQFEGSLLTKESAPSLWERVSEMAAKMGIAPPDNIFAGIDNNFFVTEFPVKVGEKQFQGRTLFVSLSLLKTLSRREADAVLAHELAHFSGQDTLYSRRISPLLDRFGHYLNALYHGGISIAIFNFMLLFWSLYQISLGKLNREREFRADRIGGEQTSFQDMGNALIKIIAYGRYRNQIEKSLFEKDENVKEMDVSARIEKGFPAFMTSFVNSNALAAAEMPHPFDSHPILTDRLTGLGLDADTMLKTPVPLAEANDSWFSAIEGAVTIEAEQWKKFESEFHEIHQEHLAWRFKPTGEVEIQHVTNYFPELQYRSEKGLTAILDYEKVSASEWDSPIYFTSIVDWEKDTSFGQEWLTIEYKAAGETKKRKQKFKIKNFKDAQGNTSFLACFEKYYCRSKTAENYQKGKVSSGETEKSFGVL